ncbi:hypothetical protein TBLA_0E04850 [Henningerozyma blattae CBS 6284]|uniref:Pre-rRNA-processing protein RIX1 n=1 Tax=Henningerozyma blattae (strain ATCC 34711 / CBS 6284 / DSM 70876 / NBRC 10599 / NRRL Y-10934 / UCD 77-7) TaxID=1071380 RepID=I2H585_HENB6|nr:hypothetical protein TBLA_0E04850 [Tetrapisispora blattae CBS 6284]CCH61537.1 hypothetical protein TBLA_0E04850 [Tetrapisispora blattae CBS 6284]
MSQVVLPVTILANRLATSEGYDFQIILKQLKSPEYVNDKLLKSELSLLVTKIQKLLQSSSEFDLWKGCHTSVVICTYNPLVLCSHGSQLLGSIFTKLEQKFKYYSTTVSTEQGRVLLETLVFAVSTLMDLMRGKPTLSREGLIPKLKNIIPTLISLTQFDPKLTLQTLQKLLIKNTTTFRPFANKLRIVLSNLLAKDYHYFDKKVQKEICDTFAYLHLIKIQAQQPVDASEAHHNTFNDETWRNGIMSVLYEFKPLIQLSGEIIDIEQDKDLSILINHNLPQSINQKLLSGINEILPTLNLDMNKPLTLWDLPKRLNLLSDLLISFISLPTPYPIRVPIGYINTICEALLSITTNFLPLKRDLRQDVELISVIDQVLPQIQFVGIKIWNAAFKNLGKLLLSEIPSILGSLELFIPLTKKSSNINFAKCKSLKNELLELFKLINRLLYQMGQSTDVTNLIKKLVDIALTLTDSTSLVSNLFNSQNELLTKKTSNSNKNNKQKKQKRDNAAGALSDLYTHSNQFIQSTSIELYNQINLFLISVLSNQILPSPQQVKVIKYAIVNSFYFNNKTQSIPDTFKCLLRTLVLFPGNERVSILPIAVTVLKEHGDEVLDVLSHARLPLSMIHQVSELAAIELKDDQDENTHPEIDSKEDSMSASALELAHMEDETVTSNKITPNSDSEKNIRESLEDIDQTKVLKRKLMDDEEVVFSEAATVSKRTKIEQEVPVEDIVVPVQVTEEATVNILVETKDDFKKDKEAFLEDDNDDDNDDDGSDFEIPAIDLSDDDDDAV